MGATSFNQVVSFDTAKVTTMFEMFRRATSFNQVVAFDTSSVWSLFAMFDGATSFNQVVAFDTSSVVNMGLMFRGAILFDQVGLVVGNPCYEIACWLSLLVCPLVCSGRVCIHNRPCYVLHRVL